MRLSVLCWAIFLLCISGCIGSSKGVSDEALQPFFMMPEEASNIQTDQFGRGMARILYIKFSLPSDSMDTLFETLCINAEDLSPTYILQVNNELADVPSWFNPNSEHTSGGTCGTLNAGYEIIVENQDDENIIYILISVL